MNNILYELCFHNLDMMYGDIPLPAKCIANKLNLSYKSTLNEMHKLQEKGFIRKCSEVMYRMGDEAVLLNGWNITNLAKNTEEYKLASAREEMIIKSIFDYDINL